MFKILKIQKHSEPLKRWISLSKLRIKTNNFCYFLSTCLFSTQTSSKNPISHTKVMYKDLFFSREVKSFFVKLVARRALLHTISTQKFAFYPHCFTSLKRNLALWSTSAASAHLLSFPQGSSERPQETRRPP